MLCAKYAICVVSVTIFVPIYKLRLLVSRVKMLFPSDSQLECAYTRHIAYRKSTFCFNVVTTIWVTKVVTLNSHLAFCSNT